MGHIASKETGEDARTPASQAKEFKSVDRTSDLKRRPSSRSSHRRSQGSGADESQSRSTASTQGSPEIDMYPSKSSKGARRSLQGSSSRSSSRSSKWLRKPAAAEEAKESHYHKDPSLPPALLVLNHPSKPNTGALPASSQSNYGKTAPVPVKSSRKTLRLGDAEDHEATEAHLDELQRMYDMRTWDMYLRIKESRKKKPLSPTMIPHSQGGAPADDYEYYIPAGDSMDESEAATNLLPEDMIFGDLE